MRIFKSHRPYVSRLRLFETYSLAGNSKNGYYILVIFSIALLIAITSWVGDFEGGDIAAARKSYLSSSPIDIWGGFSGFFYGHVPNSIFSWGVCLLSMHMIFSAVGLILIKNAFPPCKSKYSNFLFLVLSYFILNFNSYLTRDSTLLSFLLLGFGLWMQGTRGNSQSIFILLKTAGVTFVVIGSTFRPWISFPVAILIVALGKNLNIKVSKILTAIIFLVIAMVPILLDSFSYVASDIRKVHPELQVIAMDAASFSCYANNEETRSKGVLILNTLGSGKSTHEQICRLYKPNTWQSVAFWNLKESDANGLGIAATTDKAPQKLIGISTDLPPQKYLKTREMWVGLILDDPKSYFQIKVSQFGQVILAGDSTGLRVSKWKDSSILWLIVKGIVLTPYDLFQSLHLFAPISILVYGLIFFLYKSRNLLVKSALNRLDIVLLFLFPVVWSFITTIAFIGDNGRYVYPSTFLFLILLNGFLTSSADKKK